MWIKTSLAALSILAMASVASVAWAAGGPDPFVSDKPPGDYELAVTAIKDGKFAQALPLLQKYLKTEPANPHAWNYLGFSYRKLKRFDEALVAYKQALAISPNHRGANEYLGELYLQTGKPAKARERLKVLDSACFFGCEEFDDLKAAIAAYDSGRKPKSW